MRSACPLRRVGGVSGFDLSSIASVVGGGGGGASASPSIPMLVDRSPGALTHERQIYAVPIVVLGLALVGGIVLATRR